MKSREIPGCGNCSEGVCLSTNKPSKAQEGLISPPWIIENPGMTAQGLICMVASNPSEQEECDNFVQRTEEDELRDSGDRY